MTDGGETMANGNRALKLLNRLCATASWLIVAVMAALLALKWIPGAEAVGDFCSAQAWLDGYLLPILASAAVGYLTNAIAIWMLFKPYEKHLFWPHGVIPRQKKNFGHELGILIPQHLLQPEKISAQIGRVALQYLKDPDFIRRIREYVNRFLQGHSDKLSGAVIPHVQEIAVRAVRENFTEEQFHKLCRNIADHFLQDREEREKTVSAVTEIVKQLLPEFSGELKSLVAGKIAEAFKREHPVLNAMNDIFSSKTIQDEVDEFWRRGEAELLDSLAAPETRERIAGFIDRAMRAGIDRAQAPENAPAVREFLAGKRNAAEECIRDYLAERIPRLADEILSGDAFWTMLREKALPALQLYVVKQLRGDGGSLLAKVDLPGRIEKAVDDMNVEELHRFVVQASNDNLTLLQVLGFFLGGIAGVVMALVM